MNFEAKKKRKIERQTNPNRVVGSNVVLINGLKPSNIIV